MRLPEKTVQKKFIIYKTIMNKAFGRLTYAN